MRINLYKSKSNKIILNMFYRPGVATLFVWCESLFLGFLKENLFYFSKYFFKIFYSSYIFIVLCYNCVIIYHVLKISKYCFINLIFKKVQRALENVLAGTFLPLGSGLATLGLDIHQKRVGNGAQTCPP